MDNEENVEIIKPEDKKEFKEEPKAKSKNKETFNKYKKYLSPILMGLVGLIFVTNSNEVIIYAFYIIGALIAGFGAYNALRYYQLKKELKIDDSAKLTLAIVCITAGLLIVFLAGFIQTFLNLIIGLWLILTGTVRLLYISDLKGNTKTITLVESAIYILMGLYSIMVQNIFLTMIGVWMIIGAAFELYKMFRK